MTAPELLRYHPNRFATSRDFFGTLYKEYRKCDFRYGGLMSTANIKALTDRFISEYWNPKLLELPIERRPRNSKRMGEDFSLFCQVARFFRSGRNIFDLSCGLTALLRLTDVDDVRWESIRLPYTCFYLWFGPQRGWNLRGSGPALDGAYVAQADPPSGRLLELVLTTKEREAEQGAPFNYVINADPYYYFPFQIHDPASTVGDTLQETIGTSDDFNVNYPRAQISPGARRLAALYGVQLNAMPREKTAQGEKVAEMLHDLPIFREALKLVVNSLCYLCSPSREVATRHPESSLTTEAIAAPTGLQRARARNRAAREGYTLIHFCGDSLRDTGEGAPTGKGLSAHWRRGHWRNQAVGPGRSDHRLIWIRPTLVRKDKAQLGVPGHVYDVDRPTWG
jgi:hypothetical protein